MVPIYRKKVDELGADRELWIGWPTWDSKGEDREMSVKFVYPRSDGRIARSSPEVPMNAAVQMIVFAAELGHLTTRQRNLLRSVLRRQKGRAARVRP